MDRHSNDTIYGIHAVEELIKTRINQIERIFFDSERAQGNIFNLMKKCKKIKLPYQCIPVKRLDQITGTTKHQGVAALCTIKPFDDIETVLENISKRSSQPLLLVPSSLEDPRNLGALIRSCVAFDVDAILLERKNTTPLNSTVAKASAGMLEHIPVVRPMNLEKVMKDLAARGFTILGAAAGGDKKPHDLDLTGPVVIIIGGEHRGIPPYLRRLCTVVTGIPILEKVNSLNVSVAASILVYECVKQRGFSFEE